MSVATTPRRAPFPATADGRPPGSRGAVRPSRGQEIFARVLIWLHVLGVLSSLVTWVLWHRKFYRTSWVEGFYWLLNIPVSGTVLSIVLLALTARMLIGRKRAGLAIVAFFQVLGVVGAAATIAELVLVPDAAVEVFEDVWSARFLLGAGLDIVAGLVGVLGLAALWWVRPSFPGRLRRGSWLALTASLAVGAALALLVLGVGARFTAPGEPTWSIIGSIVGQELGVSGPYDAHGVRLPAWILQVASVLMAGGLICGAVLFTRSAANPNRWTADREVALRGLLADHGDEDSLGYFSTRRDKSAVFSADGRAAVCYEVVAGVSLAAGDPVGDPASWQEAIAAWKDEARYYGWIPAVLAAGEDAARAYAAADFDVLALGDEAILVPDHYRINNTSMSAVRRAAARARDAGTQVRIRRQRDLSADELAELMRRADEWRDGDVERGFSMALDRHGDSADGQVVLVTAHGPDGQPVGLLSFVPWGARGLSLDLMRRSPDAPNGTNELMVSELMARAADVGVARVSLNFAFLRGVFADAERLGAGMLTRFNSSVLGIFDRFFQLERLYRANQKFEPAWVPRYLCIDSRVSIPMVLVACGVAEGFLPRPGWRRRVPTLDAEHLAAVRALEAAPTVDVDSLAPARGDQSRVRFAHLARLRSGDVEHGPAAGAAPGPQAGQVPVAAGPCADYPIPYAVGSCVALEVADLTPALWAAGEPVRVSGRVRAMRDHGGVVFCRLVGQERAVQLVLERDVLGAGALRDVTHLVDTGDILLVEATPGASRNGTPSLLVTSWRVLAKALHPVPFASFTDPDLRLRRRSTDLIVHPDQARLLRLRSAVVTSLRRTLDDSGYLEVETPVLHPVHGGASARPFTTFINAYGVDLYLRIAPELYLKRLVVAGLGPLYEIGRNFRNEGADNTHNPEFTSLEAYQPFGDYTTMRLLTQRLVQDAATSVHGAPLLPLRLPVDLRDAAAAGERVTVPPQEADAAPTLIDVSGDWPVVSVLDAVSRAVGQQVRLDGDFEELLEIARRHDVEVGPHMGPGAVVEELYGELVEPATIYPTFYVDFPVETSPLAGGHRTDPELAERWDLVVAGLELGTAYSELTDPVEQRRRLTEQSLKAAAGDVEAMQVDEDFLRALEMGMPPTGGLGIGVDRLVMVLTGTAIRQVLTFPFVRPGGRGQG